MELYNGDCLEVMQKLIDEGVKVDMILTDPPYGTTNCKWDSIIPFDKMWEKINLLIKDNGAIVLFGSQPFTSRLIASNYTMFKYVWVWDKVRGVGHLNAKRRPMMVSEDICIFYNKQCIYNPQMRGRDKPRIGRNNNTQEVYGKTIENFVGNVLVEKYPLSILSYNAPHPATRLHPTQKPVDLLEYLIKTYTNEGDLVLDFTMGSGSTGVACLNTNRNFIGIELDKEYFDIASRRIEDAKNKLENRLL